MIELCYLSAAEAVKHFRKRELSPTELVAAVIERAESVENLVNSFSFKYYDEAMEAARASEQRYFAGEAISQLDGVPLAIKDESSIAGLPTSNGSNESLQYVPHQTSTINARLLQAGAIMIGRTTTPEFSCAPYTHSTRWGVTRNPWNLSFSPGGSSGGSAAALAAGMATVATGSDLGGSIRIPASACGLVGYKPSYGRIPADSPYNLDWFNHVGPLTRSVRDAADMSNIISGISTADIVSYSSDPLRLGEAAGLHGVKIAYSYDLGIYDVDQCVASNMQQCVSTLECLGAEITEVQVKFDAEDFLTAFNHYYFLVYSYIASSAGTEIEKCTSSARHLYHLGKDLTAIDFLQATAAQNRMYTSFGPMISGYDAFICPTNALPSVPAEFDFSVDSLEINGRIVDPIHGWCMTPLFNMFSRCPVLSVPSGISRFGIPTGIQIVGSPYADQSVFRVASELERSCGPWFRGRDPLEEVF